MPAPKQHFVGPFFAEEIIRLVAELRFYLGGENYSSGRYKGTHTLLFAVEESLRALDLDGPSAGALLEANPRAVSELMLDICRATERVAEVVRVMKIAASEAGAGGRNGGAAAAAQEAVNGWLAAGDNALVCLSFPVANLASVCRRGKPVLDATRRRVAELELLKNREHELFHNIEPVLPVPHQSVKHEVDGGVKLFTRLVLRLRQFLHRH